MKVPKLPLDIVLLWAALAAVFFITLTAALATRPLRDPEGQIHRSSSAVRRFEVQTGHSGGWPGHVVDHIVPLASGGPDDPINMQWQSLSEGKAKDSIERLPAALALEKQILACRRAR